MISFGRLDEIEWRKKVVWVKEEQQVKSCEVLYTDNGIGSIWHLIKNVLNVYDDRIRVVRNTWNCSWVFWHDFNQLIAARGIVVDFSIDCGHRKMLKKHIGTVRDYWQPIAVVGGIGIDNALALASEKSIKIAITCCAFSLSNQSSNCMKADLWLSWQSKWCTSRYVWVLSSSKSWLS